MDEDQKQSSTTGSPNQQTGNKDKKQSEQKNVSQDQQLRQEDLPDSTNESKGNTGSGQRQDSN